MVLSREEATRVLVELSGVHWMVTNLLYGSGLRVLDALRLRVRMWTLPTASFWYVMAKAGRAAVMPAKHRGDAWVRDRRATYPFGSRLGFIRE